MSDRKPCQSCGAPIVWCVNHNGKRMPFDVRPTVQPHGAFTITRDHEGVLQAKAVVLQGPEANEKPWFASHFATCPQAKNWRGKKR